MIEFLFLHLDDTILDFHKAEKIAISKTFREFGIEPTEEVLARYSQINKECWHKLELGEWVREQVLVRRFEILFSEYGIVCDGEKVAGLMKRTSLSAIISCPARKKRWMPFLKSTVCFLPAMAPHLCSRAA